MVRSTAQVHSSEVVAASTSILEQCSRFLRGVDRSRYCRPCSMLSGSTIGQHVRHSLDHFSAVLDPIEPGVIDYDHRERDTPVEHDPLAARSSIEQLIRQLRVVRAPSAAVRVRVMLSADGRESLLTSTIERELAFATHHAIHHHAMIAAIARTLQLDVPAGFGVAPSTERARFR